MTYYVLGNAEAPEGGPWVLSLAGYPSVSRAERAIAWQRVGQGEFDPPRYWAICVWDPETLRFIDPNGVALCPGEGPYTEAAWQDFMLGLEGVTAP